ncbi:helix-turn-helix domain-containing protein [Enterococcus hirae]|uniref:helix-turn-helix domain-containing protein n=1 Tax=Enterococcus hirae TaxID=1354 RepID=UPI002542B284|nr:helix-turn-helix domain-containing protein [Enterococcus hirae]MDK4467864.1 helix-turn-helix domain-containing protein [Enterococcus hirae]
MNLEDLIKKILNHSTNVQILKTIFINEPVLSKLAETLFLSETSIRRIIFKINEYFSERNWPIMIKVASQLQITGGESFIRHFFVACFVKFIPRSNYHILTIYLTCYNVIIIKTIHFLQ